MSNLNNVTSSQIWMFFFFIFFTICCSTCFSDLCSSRIPELQMLWIILFAMVMTLIIYLVWWFCIYYPYDTNILPTCPPTSPSPSPSSDVSPSPSSDVQEMYQSSQPTKCGDCGGCVSKSTFTKTFIINNQFLDFTNATAPPVTVYTQYKDSDGDFVSHKRNIASKQGNYNADGSDSNYPFNISNHPADSGKSIWDDVNQCYIDWENSDSTSEKVGGGNLGIRAYIGGETNPIPAPAWASEDENTYQMNFCVYHPYISNSSYCQAPYLTYGLCNTPNSWSVKRHGGPLTAYDGQTQVEDISYRVPPNGIPIMNNSSSIIYAQVDNASIVSIAPGKKGIFGWGFNGSQPSESTSWTLRIYVDPTDTGLTFTIYQDAEKNPYKNDVLQPVSVDGEKIPKEDLTYIGTNIDLSANTLTGWPSKTQGDSSTCNVRATNPDGSYVYMIEPQSVSGSSVGISSVDIKWHYQNAIQYQTQWSNNVFEIVDATVKENFANIGGAVSRNRPAAETAANRNQGTGFHFQVTPPKFCYNGGGDYVKPPTKEQQEYCKNLISTKEGQNLYYDYNCTPGFFNGRPLNMEPRHPESNANWENTMCEPPILADNPKVL